MMFQSVAAPQVTVSMSCAGCAVGSTYSVYRYNGKCSGMPQFTRIATGIPEVRPAGGATSTAVYVDKSPNLGSTCYASTATSNGTETWPSGVVEITFPPPTVTVTVSNP